MRATVRAFRNTTCRPIGDTSPAAYGLWPYVPEVSICQAPAAPVSGPRSWHTQSHRLAAVLGISVGWWSEGAARYVLDHPTSSPPALLDPAPAPLSLIAAAHGCGHGPAVDVALLAIPRDAMSRRGRPGARSFTSTAVRRLSALAIRPDIEPTSTSCSPVMFFSTPTHGRDDHAVPPPDEARRHPVLSVRGGRGSPARLDASTSRLVDSRPPVRDRGCCPTVATVWDLRRSATSAGIAVRRCVSPLEARVRRLCPGTGICRE